MWICVTSRTVLGLHVGKVILALWTFASPHKLFARRRVTGRAFHFEMFGFQLKRGGVMVKDFSRRKRSCCVTTRTGLSNELRIKHRFVFVHVTVFTVAALFAWEDKLLASFGRLSC